NPYPRHASLLYSDVGVLLVMARMASEPTIADALFERVAENNALPLLELLWGTPGTMLACVAMDELTGEERWRDAYRVQARRLLDDLAPSEFGSLWTQTLYGRPPRYLGPGPAHAGTILRLLPA